MANGQQLAKQNVARFQEWADERTASNDWPDYVRGAHLNRTEIAKECGFAVSALRQNPELKSRLEALEARLTDSGTFRARPMAPEASSAARRAAQSASRDKARIKALEEQNAAQRAQIAALEQSLRRYKVFDEHLAQTGRVLPR